MSPSTNEKTVRKLRKAIQQGLINGKPNSTSERLYHLKSMVEAGGMHTLEPLLPLCLSLNGEAFDLEDHFPFSPLYRTRMPSQMVVVAGRQVSKSTSLAAQGVVMSNAIPFLKTLFITPLYEQIRRFSNNYVSSFINQSPVKALWTGSSTKNSVLSKTFRNNSAMTFSFTGTDCDRIRGVSTDILSLDECVCIGTMVSGPDGDRPIETLQPGDKIYACDEIGCFRRDAVKTCSDRGIRDCYDIQLADGARVEATSDAFVATTDGWKRVSTIIADWSADTDAARDDAGRRMHGREKQESKVQKSAQLQAARVQSGEVPGIVRVRTNTSQEIEESGLRRMVEQVGHTNRTGPMAYSVLVPPRREETGNPGMAGSADLGRRSLVVSGRRQPQQKQKHVVSHAGVLQRGSRTPVFLADAEWYSSTARIKEEQTQHRASLLGDRSGCGCRVCADGEDPTIHSSNNAVQDSTAGTQCHDYVHCVREGIPCTCKPSRKVRPDSECDMLVESVQTATTQRGVREEHDSGTTDGKESAQPRVVQGRRRRKASKGCGECETLSTEESRGCCSVQKAGPCQGESRKASKYVDVSEVRATGVTRSTGCENEVLLDMSGDCDEGDQTSESIPLGASEIVAITWTGKHRVFDISTERYRTFFAGGIAVHNCQDLDSDHFPVIRETMSHSKWGITKFTGTPKTLDNTIHGLWKRSSQAEWFVPCNHCSHWNIPALDCDLEKMIGPLRDDISEEAPGTVCAKCCKPISPRFGHWVHRYPERRWDFAGYHVPQLIMPLHYSSYKKWDELLAKQRGWGNYTQARFYNEVLGVSVDAGQQLVSETELIRAGSLPWTNNPNQPDRAIMVRLPHYTTRVLAVDWGGGGESGVSFTTMALLGLAPDGKIHCLWGKRLVASQEHLREARELLHWTSVFAPDVVVHDYTGAGVVREAILVQAGFDLNRVMPIEYVRAASGAMIKHVPASVLHNRGRYRLDKTRSLLWTCQAIKLDMLRFFAYDYVNDDNSGLMHDFLALVEEKNESRLAGDIYTIVRNQMLSDDFAQAVNIGCCAIWHINGCWPNFAQAAAVGQISLSGLQAYDGPSWNDQTGSSNIFGTP